MYFARPDAAEKGRERHAGSRTPVDDGQIGANNRPEVRNPLTNLNLALDQLRDEMP